ncbi:hypothetical protein QBC42DRAFT_251970 [Cladorrhinum samala]|uniref:Uncharacterized protein n=1 Tax=Cladorrhinum samala TaxID=585594 RepID=A0AAV9HPH4_9PEZI|nr:hypothetical protein QBC42DRAFT_251970 [Cladorrhinum samala]
MKSIFFALLALASTALTTPILTSEETKLASRQLESQADILDNLLSVIQTHTANINATTQAAPENPDLAQQNAAAAALAPDLNAITTALTSATTQFAKRSLIEARTGGGGGTPPKSCSSDCLLIKVKIIVFELIYTIKFIIIKLGLACVLHLLTPLLLALVGLVKALDKVVVGLLIVVKTLVTGVLGTLAGGLLALIIW